MTLVMVLRGDMWHLLTEDPIKLIKQTNKMSELNDSEFVERDLIFGTITGLEDVILDALPHPLYVGISKSDAAKLKHTRDFVGMITMLPPTEGKRELFVNTSVINVQNETEGDSITLYVTKTFLEYYNFKCDITVFFKTVYTIPLDKIVIGVNSAELYEYMRDQKWATDLLLSICRNKVLVRAKDVWLADDVFNERKDRLFSAFTLECYPVAQGILDVKTSIIVTKTGYKDSLSSTCLQVAKQASSIDIKRTCSLFFYTFPYVAPKLTLYKSLISQSCKIEIIPQLSSKMKSGIVIDGEIFDPSDAIFLSKASMNSRKLLGGSWVKIKLLPSTNNRELNNSGCLALPDDVNDAENASSLFEEGCRFARVFSIEERFCEEFENIVRSNVVFMSPLLWFNLNSHPSPLLQPTAELAIEALPLGFKLPYASEVYISLVQSPEMNTTVDCDILRKHYFEIPRVVCSGDVLAVSSRVDITFHEKMEEAPNFGWPVVYFKVSTINSNDNFTCFLVDNNNSSIYQAGTHQSYVPVTMDAYFSPFPIHPFWEVPRPAGINAYVELLQSIVSPYLKLKNTQHQINPHILLMGDSGCGKSTVVKALCRSLNMHLYLVNCFALIGGIPGSSEARVKTVFERATMYAPCILLIENIEAIAKIKDDEDPRILNIFIENLKKVSENSGEWPVVVIATGIKSQLQNSELLSIMLHHVYIQVPSEEERKLILKALFSTSPLANDVSLSYIAQRTAGFTLGDFTALLSKTLIAAYNRIKQKTLDLALAWKEEVDISYAGIIVLQKDILNALEELQSVHAQSIGAPMIPHVEWEDVGGLADVKQEILDTIQLPLQHPELLNAGLRRSGVLLYGPPGTGKTLLAKAVATECCLNFLSVKGPELINMYVGQSEENVREVFHRARNTSPCVIFFDELDSLAPNRGRSGDSGGVMDRVVSQLLAELDGLSKSADVFVIGATNRPDLLDPALLRPGRFDRLVYVGISEDTSSRIKILQALSRKIPLAKDISLDEIEKKCPKNLSGADFYSLCSNALMNAVGRCVQRLENGEPEKKVQLAVSQEDFDVALVTLAPSVSLEELQRFVEIKQSLTS